MNAIATPVSRIDGRDKVTGAARYTADWSIPNLCYGVFVTSTIARGRIIEIDAHSAMASLGVIAVFTHANLPKLAPYPAQNVGQTKPPMQDDRIEYEGQFIALAVAETLEQAIHAAKQVGTTYTAEPAEVDFREGLDRAVGAQTFTELDTKTGDVVAALSRAEIRIEQTYRTADRHHNSMESSATIAWWQDDQLDLFDATQWVYGARPICAAALGIPPEKVRVRTRYLGGGFGCKGYVWPHEFLTAAAARELKRALKVMLLRSQDYTAHGYQPATEQRIALAATRDGRLTGIRHTSFNPTAANERYVEACALGTRSLYDCPAIETGHRIVPVNRNNPTPMRAPHEGPGLVAIECAMDELAYAIGIDPLALRLRNYAERDPTSGKAFSSKKLRECYEQGAERFGWSRRTQAPRSMREGRDLVGWGMATAQMSTFRFPATARCSIDRNGEVLVEAASGEIGGGTYTMMAQVAADALGIPVQRVRVALGDTTLPQTGGTFGSSTVMGVGSAVFDAATKLKQRLAEIAAGSEAIDPSSYAQLLARKSIDRLSVEGRWGPPPNANPLGETPEWAMNSYGAVFAEVRVDPELCIPRLTRAVGVYSAGRIVNTKTARSQMLGGMVWGLGQALLEQSVLDTNLGRYLSKNLSGYLVPVNADVPELEVDFVDEYDSHASALGARGIGELGATGIGPAIVNAVYHATGVRVRDLPIAPERLLAGA